MRRLTQTFDEIREALKPFTEYEEGDHTEETLADRKRIRWTREMYNEGEYFDVSVVIRVK